MVEKRFPPAGASSASSLPDVVLEVRALRKEYGLQPALRGLELVLRRGELVTLFGPNGAGKTTLIRILSRLLRPTSGEVLILGVPVHQAGEDVRRQLGVISHQTLLTPQLTGRENLELLAQLFRVPQVQRRVREVLEQVGLSDRADALVSTYSKGMSQRLAIARAILHEPRLILLDEPYTGLDPQSAEMLTRLLRQLKNGDRTFLMTTHSLEQGLELSDRVLIQARGRIVADHPTDGLTLEALRTLYLEALRDPALPVSASATATPGASGASGRLGR